MTEKIAKVGESTLANKLVYWCTIRDGSFLETCDIIKMAANNEIPAIRLIRVSLWYWDAWCVLYTSLKGPGKKMQRLKSVIYWKVMFKLLDSIASSVKCPILHVQGSEDWVFGIAISRWLCHWDAKIKVWWVLTKTTKKWAARWKHFSPFNEF